MKVRLLGERKTPLGCRCRRIRIQPRITPSCNLILFSNRQTGREHSKGHQLSRRKAVRLDPTYALAYAKLSQAWRQYGASFATGNAEKESVRGSSASPRKKSCFSRAPIWSKVRKAIGWISMTPRFDVSALRKRNSGAPWELSPGGRWRKKRIELFTHGSGPVARSGANLPGGDFV